MVEIHFSINIDAPKEKVWDFMIGKDTYSLWADVFMKGSYFVGDWSEGSKIQFLAPFKGQMSGMLSRVKENRPYEFVYKQKVLCTMARKTQPAKKPENGQVHLKITPLKKLMVKLNYRWI